MKLSIIVPVYNIAQYLNDCVQSVLTQSFQGWELILVNDGSTDRSATLCEEWVKKDHRIRVIHKTNGGLSDARNAGLLEAKGEYIHFLDGDDYYVSDNVLQTLIEQVGQYQYPDTLLFCRVDKYEDTGKENKERPYNTDFINQSSSTTIIFEHLLCTQRFNMSACFQILRRELLMENRIFFEKGLRNEDIDWSIALWQYLKTVRAVNCYGYCYRHRSNSITTTYSLDDIQSYKFMFDKWYKRLGQVNNILSQLQLNYLAFIYPTLLYAYFYLPLKERGAAKAMMKEMKYILEFSNTIKSNRVVYLFKYIGFAATLYLMSAYKVFKCNGWSKGCKLIRKGERI